MPTHLIKKPVCVLQTGFFIKHQRLIIPQNLSLFFTVVVITHQTLNQIETLQG
jgi:hypothetical protein